MYSLAKKMMNDSDVACDIVQDVFVSYYEKIQKGYVVEFPRSWLFRAVINKCIDHSAAKKSFVRLDDLPPGEEAYDDALSDKRQSEAIVRNAIRQLKSQEEIQLVLLYSEGCSYKEMSEITGIKFTSVGKTLSRTLKKLKEILKKMGY